MNVKTDTKEKFTVITPIDAHMSVNLTEELIKILKLYLQKDIPHIIVNMEQVSQLDAKAGELLVNAQQDFYDNNASFVICCLQDAVEEELDKLELLELMNTTPTESEAWDILQMEEIERELLSGEEDEL